MDYSKIIFNTLAYKTVEKDILSDRVSHAYMFISSDPLFLSNLKQYILARFFCGSSNKPCLECIDCKRVFNNNHPDIITYPKSDKFNVSDASDLTDKIYLKPVEKSFKVLIINNCDEMNPQSQNKLLKILEETPANTHLLLFCKNRSSMLNTFLSRLKTFETPPIPMAEIFNTFKNENYEAERLKLAAHNSFGSLQRAEEILKKENFLKILDFCYLICLNLNTAKDMPLILSKYNSLNEKLEEILNALQFLFRDCIMSRNGLNGLTAHDTDKILKINGIFSEKSLVTLIDSINACKLKLKFNCNSQTVFDILCLDIIRNR